MNVDFWRGKRVLVTGHSGFKGSWLSLWLQKSGAVVAGYALPPPSVESLYELASVGGGMQSTFADIRNLESVKGVIKRFEPEIVFHLAAQPIVRLSTTFRWRRSKSTSWAARICSRRCGRASRVGWWSLLPATSATRIRNGCGGIARARPWEGTIRIRGVRGAWSSLRRRIGGRSLKAERAGPIAVATARAGNVIGGGDFAMYRIIPDIMAAIRRRGDVEDPIAECDSALAACAGAAVGVSAAGGEALGESQGVCGRVELRAVAG